VPEGKEGGREGRREDERWKERRKGGREGGREGGRDDSSLIHTLLFIYFPFLHFDDPIK